MSDAVQMDLVIADLEISEISDAELEDAFRRVLDAHKSAVVSIQQSMKEADAAYGKYLDKDYIPLEEVAKTDRATLNKAEKNIAKQYAELKEAYDKPLETIEANIKEIRKVIQAASVAVDKSVKIFKEKQDNAKRGEIQTYFDSKNFALVSLDRLFDEKWLNKGTKMSDIREQLDEKIAVIYRDIEILERLPEHGQTAKAIYLEKLDMGAALRQVDILKENAARLAREQINREERKIQEAVAKNEAAQRKEVQEAVKEEKMKDIVDEALDLPKGTTAAQEKPQIIESTLKFRGTEDRLLKLREYMSSQSIPYQKVVILNNDRDAKEYLRRKNITGEIKTAVVLPIGVK